MVSFLLQEYHNGLSIRYDMTGVELVPQLVAGLAKSHDVIFCAVDEVPVVEVMALQVFLWQIASLAAPVGLVENAQAKIAPMIRVDVVLVNLSRIENALRSRHVGTMVSIGFHTPVLRPKAHPIKYGVGLSPFRPAQVLFHACPACLGYVPSWPSWAAPPSFCAAIAQSIAWRIDAAFCVAL